MKVKKERSCSVCTIMEQFTRVYFRKEKNKYIVCYHLFKEQNVFWVVYTKKHVLKYTKIHPSSVQLLSRVWLCDPINRSTQGLPVHQQLREFTQIHVHWVGDVIQSSHPLLSPSPPVPNPSQHQCLFQWSALCIMWPKYWSFSLSVSPSNEYPGLITFRMHWLDLFAAQGTFKSLLQHHNSKASNLWHSAFFTAQLSHPYMTTVKTIALTRRTFVGKAVSAF